MKFSHMYKPLTIVICVALCASVESDTTSNTINKSSSFSQVTRKHKMTNSQFSKTL